jgi:hypothetical protein
MGGGTDCVDTFFCDIPYNLLHGRPRKIWEVIVKVIRREIVKIRRS